MATTALTGKDEFVNTTDGWVGVVQLDHLGQAKGHSVAPGASCFLSEEEQILTANAPQRDEHNPFANGALAFKRHAAQLRSRRPYGKPTLAPEPEPQEETGATPVPQGEPEEGSLAPGEEVATPDAPEKAQMRPRRRRSA